MNDEDKRQELVELLMAIRNACQHPDANPGAILADAEVKFAAMRERWGSAHKPDEQS